MSRYSSGIGTEKRGKGEKGYRYGNGNYRCFTRKYWYRIGTGKRGKWEPVPVPNIPGTYQFSTVRYGTGNKCSSLCMNIPINYKVI
ncbi:hypothetical protein Hanom_Chr03g00274651 [Helianthus anomalus]